MSLEITNLEIDDEDIQFDIVLGSYGEDSDFEYPIEFSLKLEVVIDKDEFGRCCSDDMRFDSVYLIAGEDDTHLLSDSAYIAKSVNNSAALKTYIFDNTEAQINSFDEDDEGREDYLYEQARQERLDSTQENKTGE